MECCKCEEYKWPDPQGPVYTDQEGKGYCRFHAPANGKDVDEWEFNQTVFKRIEGHSISLQDTPNKCMLSGTIFPWPIDFSLYSFSTLLYADFKYSFFAQDMSFDGLTFYGAHFNHVTFKGFANFRDIVCGHKLSFEQSIFGGPAIFSGATLGEVTFYKTQFTKEVRFDECTFMSPSTSFFMAIFEDDADFFEAKFEEEVNFNRAFFKNKAYFINSEFKKISSFSYIKATQDSIFLHDIKNEYLKNINFGSIETYFFSFKGCDWPEKLYPEVNEHNPRACQELYRSLKQKAASEHNQPMVSQWHFREKEMALMQIKKAHPIRRFLTITWWYWLTSGYGERPVRAGLCLLGLVLLPFLITGILELFSSGFSWLPDWTRISDVVKDGLRYIPLTKLPPDNGDTSGWHYLLMSVSQLLITIQAALFAFALRNKFRR